MEKKEAEAGEWECVLGGLVEVVGTAHKGTAAPAGIYEVVLSLQGDEQSFFFSWLLVQLLTFTYQRTQPCSLPGCVSAQQNLFSKRLLQNVDCADLTHPKFPLK